MANKYGSGSRSSNSSNENYTSLNTYKDIINNRWANQDMVNGKYSVSDNEAVYNYITNEYAAGRMSSSDLANLTAMYGIVVPGSEDDLIRQRKEYIDSLLN